MGKDYFMKAQTIDFKPKSKKGADDGLGKVSKVTGSFQKCVLVMLLYTVSTQLPAHDQTQSSIDNFCYLYLTFWRITCEC